MKDHANMIDLDISNQQIAENLRDVIYTLDTDGIIRFLNPAFQSITGWPVKQWIGKHFAGLLYQDDLASAFEFFHQLMKGEKPPLHELRFISKGGSVVTAEIVSSPIVREGKVVGVIGVARDVTEQKQLEAALRTSEERYRAFVQNSSEAIWRVEYEQPIPTDLPEDEQITLFYRWGYVAECNDACATMYGYSSPDDLVGTRLDKLMPQTDPHNIEYLRAFIRSSYRLIDAESHEVGNDGTQRYFLNNLVGMCEGGKLVCTWGKQRDITEQRRIEEEIRRWNRRLQVVNNISATVSTSLSVKEIMEFLAQQLVEQMAFKTVLVMRYNEHEQTVTLLAIYPRHELMYDTIKKLGIDIDNVVIPFRADQNSVYAQLLEGKDWIGNDIAEIATPFLPAALAQMAQKRYAIKCVHNAPLMSRGKLVGTIVVGSERERISDEERAIVLSVAAQAAVAIENAQLYEEAKRKALHSISLIEVTNAINSTMNVHDLLEMVVEKVLQLTDSKHGALFLFDEDNETLRIYASRGISEETVRSVRFKKGEGIAGWVAQTGQGVRIDNVQTDPRFKKITQLDRLSSTISVPLLVKGKIVGVLGIDRFEGERPFTEEEFRIAQDFADQAALAIEKARLHQQTEQKLLEVSLLHDLAQAANESLDVKANMEDLTQRLVAAFQLKVAVVALLEENRQYYQVLSVNPKNVLLEQAKKIFGFKVEEAKFAFDPKNNPFDAHLNEGNVWLTNNLDDILTPDIPAVVSKAVQALYGIRCFVGLPLMVKGKLIGVIVGATDRETFTSEELATMTAIAHETATVIENARLFQQTQQKNRRLQKLYELSVTLTGDAQSIFDRIVSSVAELFNVPIATIEELTGGSLVIRSMFLKGDIHRGGVYPLHGTPCEHVQVEKAPCQYGNALAVFPNDAFLQEYSIRTYAGVPILDRQKNVVGVLNVMDTEVRTFTDEDIALLYTFSDRIYFELEEEQREKQREQMRFALQQSEERYRTLFHSAGDSILVFDAHGQFVDVNNEACLLTGYSRDELLGMTVAELVVGDYADVVRGYQEFHQRMRTQRRFRAADMRMRSKDGKLFDCEVNAVYLENDTVMALIRDITERKRAEEKLQKHHQTIQILSEVGKTLSSSLELDVVLSKILESVVSLFGCTSSAVLLYNPDSNTLSIAAQQGYDPRFVNGLLIDVETQGVTGLAALEQKPIYVPDVTKEPRYIKGKEEVRSELALPLMVAGNLVGVLDVQDERVDAYDQEKIDLLGQFASYAAVAIENAQLYERLKASEKHYMELYDEAPDLYHSLDEEGTIILCNKTEANVLGYSKEELIGSPLSKIVSPDYLERARAALQEVLEKGFIYDCECDLIKKNGDKITVIVRAQSAVAGDGRRVVRALMRDITEKKKTELELLRFANALSHIADAVMITDKDGVIQYVNEAFEQITGYTKEEVLGQTPRILKSGKHDSHFYRKMWTTILAGKAFRGTVINRKKNGELYYEEKTITPILDSRGNIVNFVSVGRDTTERRLLEEQLNQAQKMESIGTLVSGIAHDFNNILNNISGFAHQLQKYMHDQAKVLKYSQTIEKSASRGAELAAQLLTFVRQGPREDAPTNLGEVIADIILLAEETFPKNISIQKKIDASLMAVMGNRGELHQALLNICLNACDAMPQGGTLLIEAQNLVVGEDIPPDLIAAAGSACVGVRISDTGKGIPESIRDKIFDPFFTTKERGKGTGLGLSIVYNIVRNHKGAILVKSEEGKGSTFELYFPAVEEGKKEGVDSGETNPERGKGELILLVDDELPMQELGKELLEEKGYHVLLANDGLEAVELYRQRCNEIALVILDLIMPRMDGGKAYLEMKKINPNVKAFFCTGYTPDPVISSLMKEEGLRALQKPLRPDKFVRTVREMLDE